MRILIVRLGAFGDIIHTLPLAGGLAAAGHTVGWCCEDRWSALVTGNPAIHRLHLLPRGRWRRENPPWLTRWRDLRRLRHAIRAAGYQAVIDAQGLAKSAVLAWQSGAPCRVGPGGARAREGSWLLNRIRIPLTATHIVDQQLLLGRHWVRTDELARFPLPTWTDQRAWAAGWLQAAGLRGGWALNLGAGWPSKRWPEEHMARLLATAPGQVLLLWGNRDEQAQAGRLAAAHWQGVVAPPTTIPELAGLLAHLGVLISADTGPLHLAAALGVPCVGLFGPVPAIRNGPRGPHTCNLQAPSTPWERRDPVLGRMDQISVDQVLQAAAQVFTIPPPDGWIG